MGKYIGIDLGTTFSCAAYIDANGNPVVIPNSEGKNITPSAVLFEDGQPIVGEEAKNQSMLDPANYEQFVKRHMGERDYFFVTADNEKYTPEAISAIILKKIKQNAENFLGEPVEGCVITVPAYFTEAQKKATMDAGKIAGLNVIANINEPTAAALAYGVSKGSQASQKVMVYDLGGGTFDVTVLEFDGDQINVMASCGDSMLGGYDFDQRIINLVKEDAAEKGLDIESDPIARQDLQLKAEEAKKALSSKNKTNIVLNIQGRPYKYVLTRDEFSEVTEPLLFKATASMEDVVEEAGIEYSDLDKVLLVGGSTRMPMVRDSILEETGIEPSGEVHPDEAVAIGAAWYVLDALRKQHQQTQETSASETASEIPQDIPDAGSQFSFSDVTSHGIGIEIVNENGGLKNSVILPKSSKVPASFTDTFCTVRPFQDSIEVTVTEGEDEDLRYVSEIGNSVIKLQPRDHIFSFNVTVTCDENGILHIRMYDLELEKDFGEMVLERKNNLTEEEIAASERAVRKLDISGE